MDFLSPKVLNPSPLSSVISLDFPSITALSVRVSLVEPSKFFASSCENSSCGFNQFLPSVSPKKLIPSGDAPNIVLAIFLPS